MSAVRDGSSLMFTRKIELCTLALLVALGASARDARAQLLIVSGDPAALTINHATPGQQPDPVTDPSTTYTVTTALGVHRIRARLTTALPSGVTLTVSLVPPSGVSALGPVSLTTAPQDVVGPIPSLGACVTCGITYTLSATVSAGPVSTIVKSVEFTLVAGP